MLNQVENKAVTSDITDPLFIQEGDTYLPQQHTDSGWPVPTLHGGPVAALLAHALETHRSDAALLPARLTVDLLRAVPRVPLRVTTAMVRSSRRMQLADATLFQGDTVLARASALFLRKEDSTEPAEQSQALASQTRIPPLEEAPHRHWGKGDPPATPIFHRSVDARRVTDWHTNQPIVAWARIPQPLLPGRPLTPFERAAALADFTNVLGALTQPDEALGFINADINLNLLREPVGEWLCIEIDARAHRAGVALSVAHLHDAQGFVGHTVVNCLENRLPDRALPPAARKGA
jgi:hypothetical protein